MTGSRLQITRVPRLPELPSDLLRTALADLRRVEAMPLTYAVDMCTWHRLYRGKCHVCLGGAVLAGTLGLEPGDVPLASLDDEVRDKLLALDNLRCGEVECAVAHLFPYRPVGATCPPDRAVPHYEDDRDGFHAAMELLVAQLEEHSL